MSLGANPPFLLLSFLSRCRKGFCGFTDKQPTPKKFLERFYVLFFSFTSFVLIFLVGFWEWGGVIKGKVFFFFFFMKSFFLLSCSGIASFCSLLPRLIHFPPRFHSFATKKKKKNPIVIHIQKQFSPSPSPRHVPITRTTTRSKTKNNKEKEKRKKKKKTLHHHQHPKKTLKTLSPLNQSLRSPKKHKRNTQSYQRGSRRPPLLGTFSSSNS